MRARATVRTRAAQTNRDDDPLDRRTRRRHAGLRLTAPPRGWRARMSGSSLPASRGGSQPFRSRGIAISVFAQQVAVIGHRGLGRGTVDGLVENSAASVAAAVAAGLPWVEIDVRRTSDDALVVSHDPMTPRGRDVGECTAAEALADGMSRVEDVLAVVGRDVGVVIDVKTSIHDALRPLNRTTAALVVPLARRQLSERPLMVYGFDPSVLLAVRALAPEVPLGMLTWVDFPFRKAVPAAVHLGAQVVAAHTGSFLGNRIEPRFSPGTVADAVGIAHEAGLQVVAWCPRPDDAVLLVGAGVDALCINDVPTTLDALDRSGVPMALTGRREHHARS